MSDRRRVAEESANLADDRRRVAEESANLADDHPEAARIERFVIGALDEVEEASFVAHVSTCDSCSRLLQSEAELELSLMELAQSRHVAKASVVPLRRPWTARLPVAATALVAAAAAVLLFASQGGWRALAERIAPSDKPAGVSPVASCPDEPVQLTCIADAHRQGRRLEYPRGPLAELGAQPGLSMLYEVGAPKPPLSGLEQAMSTLRGPLQACIERNLNAQSAPVLTGDFRLQVEVAADGNVMSANTLVIDACDCPGSRKPQNVEAIASCFEATTKGLHLTGSGTTVRSESTIKYVWRE
jgi:hypothetical protein